MSAQMTFKRVELKYMLDANQKAAVQAAMQGHVRPDQFGQNTIRNIYYDTDTYRLIRASLEKPVYKEKLRIRSYQQAAPDTPVFLELKKKFKSVVYKRRLILAEGRASSCFATGSRLPVDSQIAREIDYFCAFYGRLSQAVFLSYDREAYYAPDGTDLRITFDKNILYRQEDLSLCSPVWGEALLQPGMTLMEVKTSAALPLWLTEVLTREHLYKTSFSKYGTAYQEIVRASHKGDTKYA